MSDLSNLLRTCREAIRSAYAEKVKQGPAPALADAPAADGQRLLDVLSRYVDSGDEAPVRTWASAMHDEALRLGLSGREVLSGLSALEDATRFLVIKEYAGPFVLGAVLTDLSAAIDGLLRAFVDAWSGHEPARPCRHELAALVDDRPEFVCLATVQGKPFYLNDAGRKLIGWDARDEPLPPTLHDFYTDQSWTHLRDEAVPAVNRVGRWEGSSCLRHRKTGQPIDVTTVMFRVREPASGKITCLAVVHRPPSRLDQLQQALAEAQARKHAILESSLDPIITINHEGLITEFNRAAEQVFRRDRHEVLGKQPSEILFPPASSSGHHDRIERYLKSGEGSMLGKRVEVTAVRAGGETFPAEMAMTLSYEQGLPVLSFFVRDISQRKRAEEDQARYAAELERSNRELEQFAYVASHDLQEPLRKIRTFGDRLRQTCGEQLDATGRDCLQRIESAAERMQALINGLLTLSRVTTKGQDFVRVDLQQVVREVVSDLEVQIERAGGRVEVGSLPTIHADPLQMRQLFQNLIGNALKFRRPDEPPVVKVHARFVKGRLDRAPGESLEEERCRIVVEDNGIGFEPQYAERIFNVFQRLHPRDVYEGTGVGLAICRKIVQRHGGTISAESTPGRGATFIVVLPVVHRRREA